jgi:hypothetical protein
MTVEIKVNPAKGKCIKCNKDNTIGYVLSISFPESNNVVNVLIFLCFTCYHEIFVKTYYQEWKI